MEHIYDMIIIGGGPAGYTAALYAARAGLDLILLERQGAGGQMLLTGTIDNYPGFTDGIDGFTLGQQMKEGAHRFGAKTEIREVTAVDFSGNIKQVTAAESRYSGKTVVLAMGADPRPLGIPKEQKLIGHGIHYCAHCDGGFYKGKTVFVAGGGNSAAEDALYLAKLAKTVYLVHRRDTLRADRIYIDALLKTPNIKILYQTKVTECLTTQNTAILNAERVVGISLQNTSTNERTELPCDGVFVSIGRVPATGFLKGHVMLDEHGYIIADESTKTSCPGVFAAGDVRTKALRQIITAAADGAMAAAHAAEALAAETAAAIAADTF